MTPARLALVGVLAVLVLLAGLTALPQDSWWQESQLLGYFQDFAVWIHDLVPEGMLDDISYT